MTQTPPLVEVSGLEIRTAARKGPVARMVDGISLSLRRGESLGIVGESGSGKSTLLLSLMGVLRPGLVQAAGGVMVDGRAMLGRTDEELQAIRGGKVALIPQNASTALTPTMKIGAQIAEALRLHGGIPPEAFPARILDLLARVRLPDPALAAGRYPHELSGGQLQRAAIAMALAGDPELLLLDEPTTGLDVTTQLAILDLLADLRQQSGVAMICVSHDLGVIARLCQRVAIMYAGALVEEGPVAALFGHPAHPYTRDLLASLPRLSHPGLPRAIPGAPPSLYRLPEGCRYAPRCQAAAGDCARTRPALEPAGPDARVACLHPLSPQAAGGAPVDDARPAEKAEAGMLTLSNLSVSYLKRGPLQRWFGAGQGNLAVSDLSLQVGRGEILGLVGESGSGKSTILRAIAGLWVPVGGEVRLGGGERLPPHVTRRTLAQLRAIQLVFQNPDASLNPRQRIVDILAQPIRLYGTAGPGGVRARAAELLADVRLGEGMLDRFPAQLSGGERQRVAIARAFAARPDVLLCDEITTALDVSVQAAVLKLVRDLARRQKVATIFVSHDLAVVRAIADRIAVLYAGRLIEEAPAGALCAAPRHPYTEALMGAVLETAGPAGQEVLLPDRGKPPAEGCAFAPRCPRRMERCSGSLPELVGGAHRTRCFLVQDGPARQV